MEDYTALVGGTPLQMSRRQDLSQPVLRGLSERFQGYLKQGPVLNH